MREFTKPASVEVLQEYRSLFESVISQRISNLLEKKKISREEANEYLEEMSEYTTLAQFEALSEELGLSAGFLKKAVERRSGSLGAK